MFVFSQIDAQVQETDPVMKAQTVTQLAKQYQNDVEFKDAWEAAKLMFRFIHRVVDCCAVLLIAWHV